MRTLTAIGCATGAAAVMWLGTAGLGAGPAGPVDPDADGDGLSDFQETHKYFTDPAKADTDGDGVADGEWNERREFAYTLRTITQVLKPITPDILHDDYQDARVLDETESYVELEVIAYPLNTVASAIVADPRWRETGAGMAEWTAPGATANWDEPMRAAIIAGLKGAGIDALTLSDKELVERASAWLLEHARYRDGFSTFCSALVNGKMQVYPGLEPVARREAAKANLTVEEQWQRELFAKGMFDNACRGSCTSSAIYMNGCLRALGIPTRIVLCIPVIDGTDASERAMVERIGNHVVRSTVLQGTAHLSQGWSSHTYNEVFVGGRWRRLNYGVLGQNTLDPSYFGLMIHVATFGDWMDGNMAATWGVRELSEPRPADVFGGANPYSTLSISERFGANMAKSNPAPAGEFGELTIDTAVWYADGPARLELSDLSEDGSGHILVHVVENTPGKGAAQYDRFYRVVDKRFVLTAPGRPEVQLSAERGWWVNDELGHRHFYLRIAPDAFKTMAVGVPYALAPSPMSQGECRWKVSPGVTLIKAEGAGVPVIPETVTIRGAMWSDASKETARSLAELGPVVLINVGPDKDFAAFKRFCAAADRAFVLESAGRPPVHATAVIGGVTLGEAAHGVLVIDDDSWKDLAAGVDYAIRPLNGVPGHAWVVAEGVACRRK